MFLLFCLSLIPFVTAWMGENCFSSWPVALYGFVLIASGTAYFILTHALISHHGKNSALAKAVGNDFKGKISVLIYALAIPLSFLNSWVALGFYFLVALMWLVPDRRIENTLRT